MVRYLKRATMDAVSSVSRNEMIAELERELAIRHTFYAKRVNNGQMKPHVRQWRIMCIQRALRLVAGSKEPLPIEVLVSDVVKELKRELKHREHFYAIWVQNGRMHPERARRQHTRLSAVLKLINHQEKQKLPVQGDLFRK